MEIKVKHYRSVDKDFNKIQKGGVSVAYKIFNDERPKTHGATVWFGVSVCHPEDSFSKADGNSLASVRIGSNKVSVSSRLINLVGGNVDKAIEHLIDGYLTVNYGVRIYTKDGGRQITYRLS